MQFDALEALILAVLDCVEHRVDGRNSTVRARRLALLTYFNRAALLSVVSMPNIPTLHAMVETTLLLFLAALESSARERPPAIENQLVRGVNDLAAVLRELERSDSAVDPHSFSCVCLRALQEVFDWDDSPRLQAYVWACTGELVNEGLLGKERSLLLEQVRGCVKEIDHE